MILSDQKIWENIKFGNIVITPFESKNLGSNSYDVHLGPKIGLYEDIELDCKKHNKIYYQNIPIDGYVLRPGVLYLGSTVEYTETHNLVPFLEGKSSLGRLGISIHETAGKGDAGFCGHWTLEITCVKDIKIYPGMPIAQLIYFGLSGECLFNYK